MVCHSLKTYYFDQFSFLEFLVPSVLLSEWSRTVLIAPIAFNLNSTPEVEGATCTSRAGGAWRGGDGYQVSRRRESGEENEEGEGKRREGKEADRSGEKPEGRNRGSGRG